MHKGNDSLTETVGKSQYLTWWHISDNLPQTQGMCETMSRLMCHTSRLKDDDFRLARGSHSEKVCTACDLNVKELIKHLVMQCPESEELKADMFKEIIKYGNRFKVLSTNNHDQVFHWLMGKIIEGIEPHAMVQIRLIAGYYICKMYNLRIKNRQRVE